jgi:integrase
MKPLTGIAPTSPQKSSLSKTNRDQQKLNFTKRLIEAIPTPGKKTIYYDAQVRGLGLLVQTTGHRAFFWFRKVQTRAVWKTIGSWPDLSVENARATAQDYNNKLAKWKANNYEGPGPFDKPISKNLGEVLDDYIERHLRQTSKSPDNTIKQVRQQFDCYLATWKNRQLSSIRQEHVEELHAQVGKNNGHYSANRLVSLIRALFYWAAKTRVWKGENPAKGITRFREESRQRFTQPDEFPRLFRALRECENLDLRDFVSLALFTGARRSNILAMRWDELSQTATGQRQWTIPKPKNGEPHVVPLVPEAVAVVKERRKHVTSEWVFPSDSKSGHVTDVKNGWAKLRAAAHITNLRVHDLRRTMGSWQASAGVSLTIIGGTLGHKSTAATQVYARLQQDNHVRQAMRLAVGGMVKAGRSRVRQLNA